MHPAFVLLVMEHHNRVTYLKSAAINTDTLFNFSDTISFQQHHFVKKAHFDIGQTIMLAWDGILMETIVRSDNNS